MNLMPVGEDLASPFGSVRGAARLTLGVRAQLRLASGPGDGWSVSGVVELVELTGKDRVIHLRTREGAAVALRCDVVDSPGVGSAISTAVTVRGVGASVYPLSMDEVSGTVDRWVAGWSASRRAPFRRDGAAWLVDVRSETRSRERVVAAPTPEGIRRLVAATDRPDVWLTVVGALDAEALRTLSALDSVTRDERMMSAPIAPGPVPPRVLIDRVGPVAHARIEVEGEIAARGQVAISGRDAVVDRVETTPAFRRRGFGRDVVAGLVGWAAAEGATTGLLFASVDGRALYAGLGWREVAPIATFRGREDAGRDQGSP